MSTFPKYREGIGDHPGRMVALEWGFIEYRFAPGATCEIVNIEVHPEHRMQGIGRKLLEMLFKEISGKARRVYAITRGDNEMAQIFWEKCLFTGCPLRRFYGGETGVDAILYVRSKDGPV